ncbi:hypothetical protein ACFVWN_08775 [Nocardiopsis flavescens]|uniref:hypothetical protein n=1 Tax=Nocardiopsis flavescens TaxID=758803 RepID=UPI00364D1460
MTSQISVSTRRGALQTAALPALTAATSPDARPGARYSPSGLGRLGGPPGEQRLYPTLRSDPEAARVWHASEEPTGTPSPPPDVCARRLTPGIPPERFDRS